MASMLGFRLTEGNKLKNQRLNMVCNSFLQSNYCKRVTPYDLIRGWICFSQTTECYFVLQCNSAISFSQRLNDNSWTIASDTRKNILLDVNNIQFDLNEG